jgi:hypothetical protein
MIAAYYMDMSAGVGALVHSAYKVVVKTKFYAADGTASRYVVVKAGVTAFDVHKAFFAAGQGRERESFDVFASVQLVRTNRANLRFAGRSLVV